VHTYSSVFSQKVLLRAIWKHVHIRDSNEDLKKMLHGIVQTPLFPTNSSPGLISLLNIRFPLCDYHVEPLKSNPQESQRLSRTRYLDINISCSYSTIPSPTPSFAYVLLNFPNPSHRFNSFVVSPSYMLNPHILCSRPLCALGLLPSPPITSTITDS